MAGGRDDFLRKEPRVAPAGEGGKHLRGEVYGLGRDEGAGGGDVDVDPQVLEGGVGGYAGNGGEEGGCGGGSEARVFERRRRLEAHVEVLALVGHFCEWGERNRV